MALILANRPSLQANSSTGNQSRTSESRPRIMCANAFPLSQLCTIPYPLNPAATHSPPWSARPWSLVETCLDARPTMGNPSIVNPMIPVHFLEIRARSPPMKALPAAAARWFKHCGESWLSSTLPISWSFSRPDWKAPPPK